MPKSLNSLKSWEDVQKAYSLDQILSMTRAYERSRAYHKLYNSEKAIILKKAKEAGITA